MALKIAEVGKVKVHAHVDGSTTVSIMRSGRWEPDAWLRWGNDLDRYIAGMSKDLHNDAIAALGKAGRVW